MNGASKRRLCHKPLTGMHKPAHEHLQGAAAHISPAAAPKRPRRGQAISNRGWSEAEPAELTHSMDGASKRRICHRQPQACWNLHTDILTARPRTYQRPPHHKRPRRGLAISNRGWSKAEPAEQAYSMDGASKRRLCHKPPTGMQEPAHGHTHGAVTHFSNTKRTVQLLLSFYLYYICRT